ncbi:MAG: DNA topoisomerase IV subunit B [Acholeplasmatales bacterium]|jgi:topoisomerase-4 subunit B|nr:DNA topoisomerase IV subunit B [Acholeplasmatales bacterium]
MKINNYDEKSIHILKDLEAVRTRPGMYIGSTDSRGLHHLVWEIINNSIDETLAGFGYQIDVTIFKDNSIEVSDEGRGMPYKMHESGRPTTEVILTVLHAGGKFGKGGGYNSSGGLHGVGSTAVNALSSYLELTIYRDNKIWHQIFSNGGTKVTPLEEIGTTKKTGTTIKFKPDPNVFSQTVFSYETIRDRIREFSFLLKGLKTTIKDLRPKNTLYEEFLYDDGLISYIGFLNSGRNTLTSITSYSDTYTVQEDKNGKNISADISVDVAFQYDDNYNERIYSFVNSVKTTDGGTHEVGFKAGLTRAVNEYARKASLIKEKDTNLEGSDIRESVTAVISLKIPENVLEFEGQTKSKLGTPSAKTATENLTYNHVTTYLTENKEEALKIINKALASQRAREAARKARDDARNIKTKSKQEISLSGKLTPAQKLDRDKNELFLVEGDSAGGSAKQGRNRVFQAILPLRGKVLNTENQRLENILNNEELSTIIYTIGAGYGANFDVKKSNYKKVVIMTDADQDGSHIQILLITFFFRYMKPLINDGRLYLASPPFYKVTKRRGSKEEITYAWSDEELEEIIKDDKNYSIQRFKGLGEMNADQLWDTTMNPEKRTLIRVLIDDDVEAEKRVRLLMGDDSTQRKEWIDQNVSFEVIDNYDIGDK